MFRQMVTWSLFASVVLVPSSMLRAQGRPLAPGVLTVVAPEPEYEETYSGPMRLTEISEGLPDMDWQPHFEAKSRTAFERSKTATLRRQVWHLEFAFKPLRMLYVDVPQPSGKMQKKLIWYIVYRVRYLGGDLSPQPVMDEWGHATYKSEPVAQKERYFFPKFVLESHDFGKSYQDRIIPAAKAPISEREARGSKLLNSVEMSRQPIPLSTPDDPQEVWGLVTWEDIDPRIDFFSVFVGGLTNAYKPVNLPDSFSPGDAPGTGRQILAKNLRLNFWRPGDAILEQEDKVHFGVPYSPDPARQFEILTGFGLQERLDHMWVYR